MNRLVGYVRSEVVEPLQNMSAWDRIATIVIGLLGGFFPVPGVTMIVSTLLGKFVMGFTAVQIAVVCALNAALTVPEIMAIPTFAWVGALFTGADASGFGIAVIYEGLEEGVMALATRATSMLLHACLSWVLVTAVAVVALQRTRPVRQRQD